MLPSGALTAACYYIEQARAPPLLKASIALPQSLQTLEA